MSTKNSCKWNAFVGIQNTIHKITAVMIQAQANTAKYKTIKYNLNVDSLCSGTVIGFGATGQVIRLNDCNIVVKHCDSYNNLDAFKMLIKYQFTRSSPNSIYNMLHAIMENVSITDSISLDWFGLYSWRTL
ncbi:hypothetical protein MT418_007489 [Batrachochytrium dendrobatidis]